jgi:hypothetical protein
MSGYRGLALFYLAALVVCVICGVAGAMHGDWGTPVGMAIVSPLFVYMVREMWREGT